MPDSLKYVSYTAEELRFERPTTRTPLPVTNFFGCCQVAQVFFNGYADDVDWYMGNEDKKDLTKKLEDTKALLSLTNKAVAIGCINMVQSDNGLGELLEENGWNAFPDVGCQSDGDEDGGIFFYYLRLKKRYGFVDKVIEKQKAFT